jgi:hypothetical protein
MSPKAAELLEQARQLTADERRELAIELLEAASDPAIEQAWIEEVRRRATEVDSGQVETVPHHEAWQHILWDD